MAATLLEKRQRLSTIRDEATNLLKSLSGKEATDEQRAQLTNWKNEAETLQADIKASADREATDKQVGDFFTALGTELDQSQGRQTKPDKLGGERTGTFEETDEEVTVNFADTADAQKRLDYKLQRRLDWRRLQQAGYKPCGKGGKFESFTDFLRQGMGSHHTLGFQQKVQDQFSSIKSLSIPTGMNESAGSEGGFLVPPEFAQGIIDRVYQNNLWGRIDNYSVTGNNMTFNVNAETSRANGSRHGGMRGYWTDEAGSVTATAPKFRQVSLRLLKAMIVVPLTNELLSDSGSILPQYVNRKSGEEFDFLLGDAVVNGTGVGQPTGILNAPSLVSVAKESGQAAATILPENIVKMESRFYAPNNGNSVWLKNQDTGPQLNLMTLGIGTAGLVVYMPPGGLSSAPYATLQGRPVQDTEFNATLGTQGDLIKADLKQIIGITKGGIVSAASMHVYFLTDQMALRFVLRVAFQPWESAPITPYKGASNTQSNFVALDTRS